MKYQETYSYSFEYDSLGNETKKVATRLENGITHTVFTKKYNEHSNIIVLLENNRFGRANSKTEYFYDLKNKLVKKEVYPITSKGHKGKIKKLITLEYKNDHLIKEIELDDYLEYKGYDGQLIQEYDTKKEQYFTEVKC